MANNEHELDRDYGWFEGQTPSYTQIDTTRYSDVYTATHDGEGNRLPYSVRSFISFTYGGKHIEDFGVIAVTDGDRWSHPIYADFTDITNDPEVYDGQLYWDTHHKANTWDLQLATDCMTEKNLSDFKNWFKPGVIRELILAEHPNRAILARVNGVPTMSVLPFREDTTAVIGGGDPKPIKTTVYKGEINISFVMDYPFWYAKQNILTLPSGQVIYEDGADYNGNFCEEDALKVIYEDNILVSAPGNAHFYGDNVAAITFDNASYAYMYYAGTAPCRPIIEFDFTPNFDNQGYVNVPRNSISPAGLAPYNYIQFESTNAYQIKLTTPGILSSYNYARQLLETYANGISWEELRTVFRDNLKHYDVRAYMMRVVDRASIAAGERVQIDSSDISSMLSWMQEYLVDPNNGTNPVHCVIDCESGRATIHVKHAKLTSEQQPGESEVSWATSYSEADEDAGDMLKSSYLKLEDRNYLLDNHIVGVWSNDHKEYSYRISTNFPQLDNFKVTYKNMYY